MADNGVGVGKEQGGGREELWLTVERGWVGVGKSWG